MPVATDIPRRRKARPERIRVTLWDDPAGTTPLALPSRDNMRMAGVVTGIFFAVFAAVLVSQIVDIWGHRLRDVSDLMGALFQGFWILGWSIGVFFLGALTLLFLFYDESARLMNGRLVHVPRLGPIRIIVEYDLARIRNLRIEPAGSGDTVRVRFDYGAGSNGIGDTMSRDEAEYLIEQIRDAAPATITLPSEAAAVPPEIVPSHATVPSATGAPQPLWSLSTVALIAANLVPVAGVMLHGWDLATVMVLFWAESAVIGFYTLLKIAIVGKIAVLFAGPFFLGHYGGFMAIHFMFIYEMFVRGMDARGPGPGAREALLALFVPLWPALAALFISHGVSFAVNFIARREYEGETVSGLMGAPYKRIIVMHLMIIFGGWILLALKSPLPALVLLVLLKLTVDLRAHRREHSMKTRSN